MKFPRVLKQFIYQSIFWTTLCLVSEIVLRFVFHWGYPYDYPAVPRWAMFGDFRSVAHKFAYFHSPAFFSQGPILPYPAPTAVVYKLFLPGHYAHLLAPTLIYISAIIVLSWIMLGRLHRSLVDRGVSARMSLGFLLGIYLLSFPFWFEIHQGNIEWAVWLVVSVGIAAHWQSRSSLAATCFGLAGAMKLFPFIFLGLLLARKQYRQVALAIAVATGVTVFSLWLVCPNVAYSFSQDNHAISTLRSVYMLKLSPLESGFDHSLFVLLKRSFITLPPPARLGRILDIYLASAAIGGVALYFFRIRNLPVVNQVLCLTLASILLPPVSFDYTLIHLYAPFMLFVFIAFRKPDDQSKPLIAAFILFAFLLSAQSEWIWHGVRVAGQVKAVALSMLFAVGLIFPFELSPVVELKVRRSPGVEPGVTS